MFTSASSRRRVTSRPGSTSSHQDTAVMNTVASNSRRPAAVSAPMGSYRNPTYAAAFPYAGVRVLLFHWEGEGYFQQELHTFRVVLEQRYGAHCEMHEITLENDNATDEVGKRLSRFKSTANTNELLLVAYGGHGQCGLDPEEPSPTGTLRWVTEDEGDYFVDWNVLQDNVLFPGGADTLVVLDCCFAGSADRARYSARKEVLAACPWDRKTPRMQYRRALSPDSLSFTRLLVHVLQQLASPATVRELKDAVRSLQPTLNPVHFVKPTQAAHEIRLAPLASSTSLSSREVTASSSSSSRGPLAPASRAPAGSSSRTLPETIGRHNSSTPQALSSASSLSAHQGMVRRALGRAGSGYNAENIKDIVKVIVRWGPTILEILQLILRNLSKDYTDPALYRRGFSADYVLTSTGSPSRASGYEEMGSFWFPEGRIFAIPWSHETDPPNANQDIAPGYAPTSRERLFVVIKSNSRFCSALQWNTNTDDVNTSKLYSVYFNVPVRDIGRLPQQYSTAPVEAYCSASASHLEPRSRTMPSGSSSSPRVMGVDELQTALQKLRIRAQARGLTVPNALNRYEITTMAQNPRQQEQYFTTLNSRWNQELQQRQRHEERDDDEAEDEDDDDDDDSEEAEEEEEEDDDSE